MNVIAYIVALFKGQKSVASITSSLHDTVAELEAHMEDMMGKAEQKSLAAAKALKERAEHEAEGASASKVAQNIKALLG